MPNPHYGPGVDSASNKNEFQEFSLGVKRGRHLRLGRLSRKCEILDVSQSCDPPRPLARMAFTIISSSTHEIQNEYLLKH
jgi:hypothetical protein